MSKIVFLDVDGTLVDYENHLPDSAVIAIRAARANGHRVYICTGRSRAEVYPELWDIGLDGMIGGNGSYVEDSGKIVMHQRITLDQCRHIVDWLHGRDLAFYLESNNGLFASERFEEQALPAIRAYMGRKGKHDVTVRSAFPDMIFGGELYRDDLNKASFVLRSYQDHLDSAKEFPDLQAGTWGGAGESALFGDLGVKGISKATAVDALQRHLGASREDTIAFGDAKVDIPRFEVCAYSVCMGSGGEEAKAAADYATSGVNEDGLFRAFQALHLIDAPAPSESN